MKKIVFVYDHLQTGGIATFLLNIFEFTPIEQYEITLLVKSISEEVLSQIPKHVKIKYVREVPRVKKVLLYLFHGGLLSMLKLKFRKKEEVLSGKALQKLQSINAKFSEQFDDCYDVAIGADIYWSDYYIVLNVKANKKYLWIHPQYSVLKNSKDVDYKFFSVVDGVYAVSKINADNLKEVFPILSNKIDYIANFTSNSLIERKALEENVDYDNSVLNIVTVCRLDNSSKRIDRIIKIAHALKQKGENFVWRIIGDGSDKEYIKELIDKHGVEHEVLLLGLKVNPYPYVKHSDVFVLLSSYEGVPFVVTEAMILGIPVIVSNYDSARSQVKEEFGFVVDNNDETIIKQVVDCLRDIKEFVPYKYRVDNSDSLEKYNKILEF